MVAHTRASLCSAWGAFVSARGCAPHGVCFSLPECAPHGVRWPLPEYAPQRVHGVSALVSSTKSWLTGTPDLSSSDHLENAISSEIMVVMMVTLGPGLMVRTDVPLVSWIPTVFQAYSSYWPEGTFYSAIVWDAGMRPNTTWEGIDAKMSSPLSES